MWRVTQGLLLVCLVAAQVGSAEAQVRRGELISQAQVEPYGLYRRWFNKARVAASRGGIASVVVAPGMLLVQTDQATVEALDSETGRSMWQVRFGESRHLTQAPGANAKYVAVTNGPHLYVYDRATGAALFEQRVGGAPSAGCAIGPEFVYVPLTSGAVEAYKLERKSFIDHAPVIHFGTGMAEAAPAVGAEKVYWSTSKGFVYGDGLQSSKNRFRLAASGPMPAPPVVWPPLVFAGAHDGYMYGLEDDTGGMRWEFSTGTPIRQPPIAVEGALFVVSDNGSLFRIAPATGQLQWYAQGVMQLLSVNERRVYGVDIVGRLVVLDAKTGSRLGVLGTELYNLRVQNPLTDRIYLGTTGGTIVCLSELGRDKPLVHLAPVVDDKPAKPTKKPAGEGAEDAAPGEMPADGMKPPAGPDPFGM